LKTNIAQPCHIPRVELQELVDPPRAGRVFELSARPGLGDCAPSGRARLDALARWCQDVAYADVEDAGLAEAAVWVVRRTRVRVARFPRFGEHLTVATFCSGIGRMWAERRTRITREGDGGADVDVVATWVHLDPVAGRPTPLTDREIAVYGGTGSERRISARLRHPAPGSAAKLVSEWRFRRAECDLADHVNNAAYWLAAEEELLERGEEPAEVDVELEFRTPSQPGPKRILTDGDRRWIVDPDETVNASLWWARFIIS
jgi:acyl-ACP thioesterase